KSRLHTVTSLRVLPLSSYGLVSVCATLTRMLKGQLCNVNHSNDQMDDRVTELAS
ncbi:hypothetical protein J6590_069447, partial [Homalodisca vitripennis]